MKRRFLEAASADKRGGRSSTGWRYWVTYCVHVLGVSPFQPRFAGNSVVLRYEEWLEDMACWVVEYRPSGRDVSAASVLKYVSSVRGTHKRFYGPLGVGAANSRIPDLMKGAARLIPQPPPLERHGCAPAHLRLGLDARHGGGSSASLMWRAALTFGEAALARGCEFALDADRNEVFEASEHLTANDWSTFSGADGVLNARMKMRKRKDLKVLRGKQSYVVLAGGGGCFDAVAEVVAWVRRRRELGLPDDGPLFCHANGVSITTRQVREEVRAVMAAAGQRPELYGAHSLRIGGATAALAAGVPPGLIRLMGRWSSDVYEVYCRMSVEAALNVGRALASAEVTTFEGFKEEHLELLPHEVRELEGVEEDEM